MSAEEKYSKLLSQVLRSTYAGSVTWQLANPPANLTRNTDDFVTMFFKAYYKNSEIVIYEVRGKNWADEETFHWGTSVRFGVLIAGSVVVTDPVRWTPLLGQLFDAAKKQATGIDSIIDNLLD